MTKAELKDAVGDWHEAYYRACGEKDIYTGPMYWRSTDYAWSYEYNTRPMGILKAPVVYKCLPL